MEGKQQVIRLDAVKFFLSLCIVIYHYNYFNLNWSSNYLFKGGYLAVDIFFIITGFLFYNSINKKNHEIKIKDFILRKTKKLYSQYIFALILIFVYSVFIKVISESYSILSFLKYCIHFISEAIFIQEWGIPKLSSDINGVTWYISAMILDMILLLLILKISNYKYNFIIFCFISISIYIFFIITRNNIHVHGDRYAVFITSGVLRGLAGISMGCICNMISKIIKNKKIFSNKILDIFLWSFSLFLTCFVLIYAKDSLFDFMIIPVGCILVISSVLKTGDNEKIKKIYMYGGSLSYVIYLNHILVKYLLDSILKNYSLITYLASVLIVAIIIKFSVENLQIIFNRKKKDIKLIDLVAN
jgi:peptidoglycan/LPS O-acetylase OafA/YrhL